VVRNLKRSFLAILIVLRLITSSVGSLVVADEEIGCTMECIIKIIRELGI